MRRKGRILFFFFFLSAQVFADQMGFEFLPDNVDTFAPALKFQSCNVFFYKKLVCFKASRFTMLNKFDPN